MAETRSHRHSWTGFKRNVLDPLGAELALCVATPADYDYDNPFWANAAYRWTTDEYADYGDAFDFASSVINGDDAGGPDWRILLEVGNQWLGGIKGPNRQPGSAAILIFFRWLLWRNILKEGLREQFTHFLVTRSDFVWTREHPDLLSIDDQAIWLPNGEGWGGVTDRYALLPAGAVEAYLNILEEVLADPEGLRSAMAFRGNWNLERFIDFSIERRAGRPIRTFPYFMYSVRELGGTTRWSRGELDPYERRYVKYPTEYVACSLLDLFLENAAPAAFDRQISEERAIGFRFTPVWRGGAGAHIRGELIHNVLSIHDLDGFGELLVMPVPHIFRPLLPKASRFMLRTRGGQYVRRTRSKWARRSVPPPPPQDERRAIRFLLLCWLLVSGGLFRAEPIR